MTGVFLSAPRYNWCAPVSHPSSCMLVNHGPSQQSSIEEYKPWKWDATARYFTSHTKTMLPTRKSVPSPAGNWTTRRPLDDRKETQTAVVWSCLPFIRSSGLAKTTLQGTVKGGRKKADRGRGGQTTSGNGQAWISAGPKGQWRTGKNGENCSLCSVRVCSLQPCVTVTVAYTTALQTRKWWVWLQHRV